MDMKLELVIIPVSDVDRAKDFYTQILGFKLEVDGGANEGARNVQVTPPGSECSVGFGSGLALSSGPLVTASPGSQRGLHLAVTDIVAVREQLISRGVDVGGIEHVVDGRWTPGVDPGRNDYMSFAEFSDPDDNLWLLQEIHHHDPANPDDFDAFLARWLEAERTGDSETTDRLLTDDFVGIGPVGFQLSKSSWVDRLSVGDLKYETLSLEEVATRFYGPVAVTNARWEAKGTSRGQPIPESVRVTLTSVNETGWKMAGIHYSFIAGTPGAPTLGPV